MCVVGVGVLMWELQGVDCTCGNVGVGVCWVWECCCRCVVGGGVLIWELQMWTNCGKCWYGSAIDVDVRVFE